MGETVGLKVCARLLGRIGILAAAAIGLLAAPAQGAEVVGSQLTATSGVAATAGYTFVASTPATGASLPIAAPAAGAIVSVRLKHSSPGSLSRIGFRILSGTDPLLTARLESRLPDLIVPMADPAGISTIIPADESGAHGVHISAGERLGLAVLAGSNMGITATLGATPGANYRYFLTTTAGTNSYLDSNGLDGELLLQYTVEPDADGDGWGDETQDRCSDDPVSNCPGRVVTNVVTTPAPVVTPPVESKKCKKKTQKRAATAKKKGCKKKKRK